MKNCPSCGSPNEDTAVFCDNCGGSFGAPASGMPPSAYPATQVGPAPAGPAAGTINCPTCGHPVILGEMFCENCGASMSNPPAQNMGAPSAFPPAQPTPSSFPPPQPSPYQPPAMPPQYPPVQQYPQYPPQQPVYPPPGVPSYGNYPPAGGRVMIGGTSVALPQKTEVTIGRPDQFAQPPWQPDIDLTPYGGGDPQSGVSRRHARLVWQGQWFIEDMNSVNGVFVHGQKIFQRTPLNNGDQIGLGRLILTFYS